MFDIFRDIPDCELYSIYKDILKSEEDGLRPKSLDSYAKKIQEICRFEMFSQATNFTKELFYKEVARRYFDN